MAFPNHRVLSIKVRFPVSPIVSTGNFRLTYSHSLHATPMWLTATYSPAFQPVNKYFAPSQWYADPMSDVAMPTEEEEGIIADEMKDPLVDHDV